MILVLFFIFLINILCFDINIGYIDDTTLDITERNQLLTQFNNYIDYLNYDIIGDGKIIFVEKIIEYPSDSNSFENIWTKFVDDDIELVFSYCQFITKDPDNEDYDLIGNTTTVLVCATEDYLSLCLNNVFFFTSSKSVIYRCIFIIFYSC